MQVERYKELNGHYPELVQVDKIYLNRTNRAWLKERNIRHTGDSLGRKPVKSYYMRRKERREAAERNQIKNDAEPKKFKVWRNCSVNPK
jgi:transposase, IS5 family